MISKSNPDITPFSSEEGGIILIDKPMRWSSFKVIHELRKHLGLRKAGHAGTLDPLATGLLIVCSNKKTKVIDSYQGLQKTYSGSFYLGKITPSMDYETEPFEEKDTSYITGEMIHDAAASFVGEIEQIPPMFSAVNHKGKKLYELARAGKEIERQPRKVQILRFSIDKIEMPHVHFTVECSKGTYIRVLASDFGAKLGCGAFLASLRREAIGEYSVQDAFDPRELSASYKQDAQVSIHE
jgi:tRNA pseudouridine55 synthase